MQAELRSELLFVFEKLEALCCSFDLSALFIILGRAVQMFPQVALLSPEYLNITMCSFQTQNLLKSGNMWRQGGTKRNSLAC